jgi:DNA-binding PadR family transcriptional regulator
MTHPSEQIDDDVHQRVRLGVLALLSNVSRADFAHLKSTLRTTDGNLGRHLRVLEDAGFVDITKVVEGRRPRTWVKITRQGRTALHHEIEALKEIVAMVEGESDHAGQIRHPRALDPGTA